MASESYPAAVISARRCYSTRAGQAASLGDLALDPLEIMAAVRSLYAEGLKPYGRVLLKRLRERAAARLAEAQGLPADTADIDTSPRVNPKALRKSCAAIRHLILAREDGREYSVMLAGEPQRFLDVCSPVDNYPAEFWSEFAAYLEKLADNESILAGGRYACAQRLVSRKLSFFEAFSLGQVCHIVQLAITQRKLLGHREGSLVPYKKSDDYMKEVHAITQSPIGSESLPVISTWEDVRRCLQQLLTCTENFDAPHSITISNIKRLFRLNFELDLSETALGHVRLLDLLQDPRLQDVCLVHRQGNRLMVTSAVPLRQPQLVGPAYPVGVWSATVQVQVQVQVQVPMSTLPIMAYVQQMEPPAAEHFEELKSPGAVIWGCESASALQEETLRGLPHSRKGSQSAGSTTTDGAESNLLSSDSEDIESPVHWSIVVNNTFIDVSVQDHSSFISRPRRQTN